MVDRPGGAVLRSAILHRGKVSAVAWIDQIWFRTCCFKLKVSVSEGIPGACLAGAFYLGVGNLTSVGEVSLGAGNFM